MTFSKDTFDDKDVLVLDKELSGFETGAKEAIYVCAIKNHSIPRDWYSLSKAFRAIRKELRQLSHDVIAESVVNNMSSIT